MKSDGDVSFHSSHVSYSHFWLHLPMLLPELQFGFLEQTAQSEIPSGQNSKAAF